jgi:A/G-specific adenine glycosylase
VTRRRGAAAAGAPPTPADPAFARALLRWQAQHGRHDLPWQATRDPYRVWLSEIMLQQTRVETVLGYYERFLQRFPGVDALAAAPLEQVLALWAGLGYYARARQAHRCAALVAGPLGGRFPDSAQALAQLPGIGPSTAAAIAAFCHGERAAILDGNVQRVLARRFAIEGDPRRGAVRQRLQQTAQALLPASRHMPAYTQAIMDLGATLCTRHHPDCARCPVRTDCLALAQGRVDALPQRAPARARPVRQAGLLVVLHRGAVLLEQRPARGIWGGLLGLPQFERPAELQRAARALGGTAAAGTPRRHGFTHFTLEFTPWLLRLARGTRPAPAPGQRWLPLTGIDEAPLPAPVRVLLRELRTPPATGARRAA